MAKAQKGKEGRQPRHSRELNVAYAGMRRGSKEELHLEPIHSSVQLVIKVLLTKKSIYSSEKYNCDIKKKNTNK